MIAFLFGTVFVSVARKKMPDKCVVFGCNNRPNKEKGISLYPIFYGTDDTEKRKKKKAVSRLRKSKACSLETHEILGGVFKTRPR